MESCGLRFAVVCRHNMNRSVQVHRMMKQIGLNVQSYGTRSHISLPGRTRCIPVTFPFGTSYTDIYNHLVKVDCEFYRATRILEMVEENIKTKIAPEQFQDTDLDFDVIITLDPLSQSSVIKELYRRQNETNSRRIQLIHMSVEDELENIRIASHHAAVLALLLQESSGDCEEIKSIIERFNEVSEPDGYVAAHNVFHAN